MGIMAHSTSKKIDVDDLKGKLAETLRRDKYAQSYQAPGSAEVTLKKAKKQSEFRQKSPMRYNEHSSSNLMGGSDGGNASTIKMYGAEDTAPAWYKSLKKNVK
jgi:hypothetical protein